MSNFDITPEIYIGVRGGGDPDPTSPIISYMNPVRTANSANKKSLQSIRNWIKGYRRVSTASDEDIKVHTIPNTFISGFKIVSSVSRYSTDNKVFEIEDPRGFILQIYADNLMEILSHSTVNKGVISGEGAWTKVRGNTYLVLMGSPTHDEYLKRMSSPKKRIPRLSSLDPGSIVKLKSTWSRQLYLGKADIEYYVPPPVQELEESYSNNPKLTPYIEYVRSHRYPASLPEMREQAMRRLWLEDTLLGNVRNYSYVFKNRYVTFPISQVDAFLRDRWDLFEGRDLYIDENFDVRAEGSGGILPQGAISYLLMKTNEVSISPEVTRRIIDLQYAWSRRNHIHVSVPEAVIIGGEVLYGSRESQYIATGRSAHGYSQISSALLRHRKSISLSTDVVVDDRFETIPIPEAHLAEMRSSLRDNFLNIRSEGELVFKTSNFDSIDHQYSIKNVLERLPGVGHISSRRNLTPLIKSVTWVD